MMYAVDLPDPHADNENVAYVNVDNFTTKKDALEYLSNVYGLPEEIANFFITQY